MGPTDCDRARERLSLELDGELSQHAEALLERHLSRCAACSLFADDLRRYTELLRTAPLEQPPPFALPRLTAASRFSARVGAAVGSTAAAALVAVSVLSFGKPAADHSRVGALDFAPSGVVIQRVKDVPLGLRQASDLSPVPGREQQGRIGSSRRGLVGS